jgi:hypothetical protein
VKYTIFIKQNAIIKNGLAETTDLIDWAIIDYILWSYFSKNGKHINYLGKDFVWFNYNAVINNLPLIKIHTKTALSARIEGLYNEGLVETYQAPDHTLYIKPSDYALTILSLDNTVHSNDTGGMHQNDTAQYNNYLNKKYLYESIKSNNCNSNCNSKDFHYKNDNNEIVDEVETVAITWNDTGVCDEPLKLGRYPNEMLKKAIKECIDCNGGLEPVLESIKIYGLLYHNEYETRMPLLRFIKFKQSEFIPKLSEINLLPSTINEQNRKLLNFFCEKFNQMPIFDKLKYLDRYVIMRHIKSFFTAFPQIKRALDRENKMKNTKKVFPPDYLLHNEKLVTIIKDWWELHLLECNENIINKDGENLPQEIPQ